MRKIIITYGIIAGVIVSVMLLATQPFLKKDGVINFENGMFIGYTTMVIALSMIFFGIKSFRDHYNNGKVTFGQGFKIGILISVIAAFVYAASWEICYNLIVPDFTEQYSQYYIEKVKNDGGAATEIAAAEKSMRDFNDMYQNPVIRFGLTIMEILPVGIVITCISALLLRKREILPA
jgi:hypothetical protein